MERRSFELLLSSFVFKALATFLSYNLNFNLILFHNAHACKLTIDYKSANPIAVLMLP